MGIEGESKVHRILSCARKPCQGIGKASNCLHQYSCDMANGIRLGRPRRMQQYKLSVDVDLPFEASRAQDRLSGLLL